MKKKKILVSTILLIALFASLYVPVSAANIAGNYNGYHPYSDDVTTYAEQEQAEREFFRNNKITINNIVPNVSRGVDPGNGAVNFKTTQLYSSGTIYWDTVKESSVLSSIANIALAIYGKTVGTVISVAQEVLTLCGISGTIDQTREGIIKVGHSNSYMNKVGQFYYKSYWYDAVFVQKRFCYEHLYATVVIGGTTRQKTVDKIPDYGYSAYLTETRPYYNQTVYLRDLVTARYNDKVRFGYFAEYRDEWVTL